jgi:hypothetical protein
LHEQKKSVTEEKPQTPAVILSDPSNCWHRDGELSQNRFPIVVVSRGWLHFNAALD